MSIALKIPVSRPDEVVYVRPAPSTASSTLRELDVIVLVRSVTTAENVTIPAGALGAIVAVWDEGASYEVEFAEPVGALATVAQDGVRQAYAAD